MQQCGLQNLKRKFAKFFITFSHSDQEHIKAFFKVGLTNRFDFAPRRQGL